MESALSAIIAGEIGLYNLAKDHQFCSMNSGGGVALLNIVKMS